jgi:expansin (peptidoglycan-binding protein)
LCAVAVLLFTPSTGGGVCAVAYRAAAAQPPAAGARAGQATYYTLAPGAGNCSYIDPPPDKLYVALSPADYSAAARCGGYLDVTGPNGTVRVKIVDQCPECAADHLDLSEQAFARIGAIREGVISITYRTVRNPVLPGPLSVRVKDGSSQYWLALLIIDHGNPLSVVEIRRGSGWRTLEHADFNYWIAEGGVGTGPFTLRVTDNANHQVVVDGIALTPGTVQRTDMWMYGARRAAPTRPAPDSSLTAGSEPTSQPTAASPSASASAGAADASASAVVGQRTPEDGCVGVT